MSKDNQCAGSYSVNGYIRADNTQVSGYIRTCGAAHNSTDSSAKSGNSSSTSRFEIKVEHNEYKKPNSWKEKIKNIVSRERKEVNELLEKRAEWGIAYKKYAYKPNEAIEKLLKEKQGFVPSAIRKKGIGDIDFVWGNSNGGLKHIVERRNNEGLNGENFIREIPQIIEEGKVITKSGHNGRKYVEGKNKEVVIRLDWNQKERKWLVTSYNRVVSP